MASIVEIEEEVGEDINEDVNRRLNNPEFLSELSRMFGDTSSSVFQPKL